MSDSNKHKPPKLAKWLLSISVAWKFKEEVENDLNEIFKIRIQNWGLKQARRQYWRDVFSIWIRRSWFHEFEFTHLNTFSMLKNYLKVTLRTLRKQKIYSVINIFGLAVGLAFCALIMLFVQDELNYDKFHENKDRIFRVERAFFDKEGNITQSAQNLSIPVGPSLEEEVPGVQSYVRTFGRSHYVKSEAEPIKESVMYADPELLNAFSFPLKLGNPETALEDLNSVVISQKIANRYFGDENPMGETLSIRKGEVFEDFVVTGLLEEMPHNSTIRFDMLLNIKGERLYNPDFMNRWDMSLYRTFVFLEEGVNKASLDEVLDGFFINHHADYLDFLRERDGFEEGEIPATYRLNPLEEIHFSSVSDPKYSFILSGIALAILLIACFNFMTLSIGRSSRRSKEIGMRKVIGAQRHQLMFQFWSEAFIICIISLIFGVLLAETFLPVFNQLSGKSLDFVYTDIWGTLAGLTGLIILTGLISGSYPALVLSSIQPLKTLKGKLKLSGSNTFTKTLVVIQFGLSMFLIIGTLVMKNQLEFLQERDPGFNKDHVVTMQLNNMNAADMADKFRNIIGSNTNIREITSTGYSLGMRGSMGYGFEHNGKKVDLNVFTIESNYFDFMDLEIVEGRALSPNRASDTLEAIVVNETFLRELEINDPIGKQIPGFTASENPHGNPYIVGVVKDHNFQSLYIEMEPAFFTLNPVWPPETIMVRINPAQVQESISAIKETWKQLVPTIPFSYTFLDDSLMRSYREDERWAKIINYSSWFAIVIACMGLFGLVTLSVSSRKKEIGIRKVLGASISSITGLFAKDFVKLVAIGVLISVPIAHYGMNQWLVNFAYRINIGPEHFFTATGIILLIAILTISVQTIRAGKTNPAETLMNE